MKAVRTPGGSSRVVQGAVSWSVWDGGDRRRRPDRGLDRPGACGPVAWRRGSSASAGPRGRSSRRRRRGRSTRRRPTWPRGSPGPRSWWSARRSAGSPTTSGGRPRPRPADVLVTDAGSTKRRIVEAVEAAPARRATSSSAPTRSPARSAQGSAHARADLFEGRVCVLTPTPAHPGRPARAGPGFWTALGCRVVEIDPAEHDEVLALTSHLPHAVAAGPGRGGPRRVARRWPPGPTATAPASPGPTPALWTAIFRENRGPLLKALGTLEERSGRLQVRRHDRRRGRHPPWWDEAGTRRRPVRRRTRLDRPERFANLTAD